MSNSLYINHIQQLLTFFMILGVIASSVSGAIRAIEARMDITGSILLAFVSANAGGTIRDVIISAPIFWINQQFYIWITIISGIITFGVVYVNHKIVDSRKLHQTIIITDALGLAAFTLAGLQKSLALGQNNYIAIIMGIWTAIGGGIMADIITNRVPLVLSKEFYIIVSLVGGLIFLILDNFISTTTASGIATLIMIIFRIYSVKYCWKLPIINT